MKSRYVSLRKNPAGSPEDKKISYPGKGTRFGKHLFITCLKIEYTQCRCSLQQTTLSDSFKSLTTKKHTTKFSANFRKMSSPSYIVLIIQRQEGKQCRSR